MKRIGSLIKQPLVIGLAVIFLCYPVFIFSASIDKQADQIKQDKTILQKKADKAEKVANSLAEKVALMNEQIKQVDKEIKRTKKELKKNSQLIIQFTTNISQKETELKEQKAVLDESICYLYEEGDQPFIDTFFSAKSFNDVIDRTEYLAVAETKVEQTVDQITELKTDLENKKSYLQDFQQGLKELTIQLKVSKQVINKEKKNKKELLAKTKGKEDRYQELINAKQAEERAVLARISKLEQTGQGKRYTGKPNKTTPDNNGDGGQKPEKITRSKKNQVVFQWPLKKFVLTQKYGCTSFARCGNKKGPYGGKPHNGIDLSSRANKNGFLDLRVRSVMAGKVIMNAPEKFSGGWGNAVVVAHPNGLFTLYGHMSRVIVKEGQKVRKGQMIGIEGSTGFSTGRHLHFSVYMEIIIYKTKWYYGPGYDFPKTLNPLIFLPKK